MTLMGVCSEVRMVRASELLDYTNYEGDYETEMGIGREPEFRPVLENSGVLIFAWGATVPMIAHAAGIMLDEITTTWDKWVTPTERTTAKGVIKPGHVAAVRFTIDGVYRVRHASSSNMSTASGMMPPPTGRRATTMTSTGWISKGRRASSRKRRSGSLTARAGTRPRPGAWRPGCVRSTRSRRSTTCGRAG